MRKLTEQQKAAIDAVQDFSRGEGNYPKNAEMLNLFLYADLKMMNDYETLYEDVNRYMIDRQTSHRLARPAF